MSKSTGKHSITNFFQPIENPQKKAKIIDLESPITIDDNEDESKTCPDSKETIINSENTTLSSSSISSELQSPSAVDLPHPKGIEQLWDPLNFLDPGWRDILKSEFSKQYFKKLESFVDSEYESTKVFPPIDQLFTAFQLCKFEDVKVVIIGQDPYHAAGQAHGLAFSVQEGVTPPPSLRNIFTEAKNDVGIPKPPHGNLKHWAEQGVLLLNTCLTVRSGQPLSHQKKGWEVFTDAVVQRLARKEGLVYLLWGKPAQKKCIEINKHKNRIITSSHPSPLAAHGTSEPFMGSRMFSRCNEALESMGHTPIDWRVL